ncbi:hypothetical protein [Natrarchaeobius chitinivorans]|uniref:Uncharacterized protein n=1 Tax=Natrarchaeobius chitinivorans TaxID=1679083 RepID=A0A3N6M5L2_NATCH|nr:hypothetical protein [Natrarchaeobius chitinivorans]RQG90561.1 hypothetical protein EA473_20640 [Natrarchaeobius chitinivorans]
MRSTDTDCCTCVPEVATRSDPEGVHSSTTTSPTPTANSASVVADGPSESTEGTNPTSSAASATSNAPTAITTPPTAISGQRREDADSDGDLETPFLERRSD